MGGAQGQCSCSGSLVKAELLPSLMQRYCKQPRSDEVNTTHFSKLGPDVG